MISVIIVSGKVFHCLLNNPSDNITVIRYLGTVRLLQQQQKTVLYVNMENMDFPPPIVPSLVFARETYTPYKQPHPQTSF